MVFYLLVFFTAIKSILLILLCLLHRELFISLFPSLSLSFANGVVAQLLILVCGRGEAVAAGGGDAVGEEGEPKRRRRPLVASPRPSLTCSARKSRRRTRTDSRPKWRRLTDEIDDGTKWLEGRKSPVQKSQQPWPSYSRPAYINRVT